MKYKQSHHCKQSILLIDQMNIVVLVEYVIYMKCKLFVEMNRKWKRRIFSIL